MKKESKIVYSLQMKRKEMMEEDYAKNVKKRRKNVFMKLV